MFTIIIATHDRPHLLHRTLQSLVKQSFRDFTTIIVSDSSTYIPPFKDLEDLKGRFSYLIHNAGDGPASSRNMGIQLAQSDYVMFLDDDDTLEPDHLMMLSKTLPREANKIAFCDFKILEEDRNEMPPKFLSIKELSISGVTKSDVYVINRIPNSCLIYPLQSVKSQLFDGSIILYEDWDFLLKCLGDWDLSHIPISSVVIHKSYVPGAANARRGNSSNDKLVEVTLELYRRYPAPSAQVKQARHALLARSGIQVALEQL